MNDEEKDSLRYRFSGYQLPKMQLDETGDSYIVLDPHPYYYNQPEYWQKPASTGDRVNNMSQVEYQSRVVPQEVVAAHRSNNDSDSFTMLPL